MNSRENNTLLQVENLIKHFPVTAGVLGKTVAQVQAVSGVSFDLQAGETLGLVGESGCGKTTVGRCILRLTDPTAGRIVFEGRDITSLPMRELRPMCRDMQIIFQDPYSSLNPRMTVRDAVGEPLLIHRVAKGRELNTRVAELMERVGLPAAWMNRYPHEFSGGQRQRIGIARAIALNPKFIVCDEAVSALDVSVRAQVLNLLIRLREEMNLSYLFIAHDLSVVKHISHRVAVMYLGHIMEIAPRERLFSKPAHPYTLALFSAIPVPDPVRRSTRIRLQGDVPTPLHPPRACRFHTRCPAVFDRCRIEEPDAIDLGGGHFSKCFLSYDLRPGDDWHEQVMARYEEHVLVNRAAGHAAALEAPATVPTEPTAALETDTGKEPAEPAASMSALPPSQHRLETEVRAKPLVGLVLMLAGVAWALLANVVAGSALVFLAFWLLVFPRADRRDGLILFFIAVMGISIVLGLRMDEFRRNHQARVQLASLNEQINDFYKDSGFLPARMEDLSWRLHEVFHGGQQTDPWGKQWNYARGDNRKSYNIRSAGPDQTFYTEDDVQQAVNL